MSKYNVHGGHNKTVPGASGYLNEVTENRKVKNLVISYLKSMGHTVYDCTDDAGKTQSKNLSNIVAKCNQHDVALDISIHLNAGGGTGTEVIYVSSSGKTYAEKVSKAVASSLKVANRGAKKRTDLYVLNHTKSAAIIIECCFVDSKEDKEKWDAKVCAKAIAEAVTGKKIQEINTEAKENFLIKVNGVKKGDVLNIRASASASSKITGTLAYNDPNKYTITQISVNGSDTWGKLKSKIGWINLEYTKRA